MSKYYYTPKASSIEGTILESEHNKDAVLLVVTAESLEEALDLSKSIVDTDSWQLDHIEE